MTQHPGDLGAVCCAAPVVEAALAYADRGWRVIPVHSLHEGACSCGKPDCDSPGKHPRTKHGHKDATTDKQKIEAWYSQHPDANVGIATGVPSGFFALDVDPKNGGNDSLTKLKAEHGDLPDTVEQVTGGGGRHYLFKHVEGVGCSAGKLAPGLDIRGDGGYVVVAPSRTIGKYRWREGHSPDEIEMAEAPTWLVDEIAKPAKVEALPVGGDNFIHDGARNTTLASLAGSMRRRGMTRQAIEAALQEENRLRCRPPLAKKEVATIAKSISEYSANAKFETTDLGNAERLVARHGLDLKFCKPWGKWLVWDGRRWRPDETENARLRAMETACAIYEEVAIAEDADRRRKLVAWGHISQSRGRLDAMLSLAQPLLPVSPAALDRHLWLLNVENGTLDLRTGDLRPHERDDLITKLAPVTFDPEAPCQNWNAFLNRVTDGRPDLSAYQQRMVGYTLTGDTSEHCVFLQHGTGRNGKTTFNETVSAMMGDYARKTEAKTFLNYKNEGVRNDIAALKGARLVTAAEVGSGRQLNEQLVKETTGGDTVTARFLYGEFFEYRPEFKIFLSCNHKPEIRGQDEGIWSRVRVVPFDVFIPPAERDKKLPAKLRLELSGILNWALAGCLEWQQNGLQEPQEVLVATGSYREDMDPLGPFLTDCCVTPSEESAAADKLAVPVAMLYARYEIWCESNGAEPLPKNTLGRRMAERGYPSKSRNWKGKKQRVYDEIALRSENQEKT